MKKFLSVMLLAVILIGTNFATADAAARIRGLWACYYMNGSVPEGEADYFTDYSGRRCEIYSIDDHTGMYQYMFGGGSWVKNKGNYYDVLSNPELFLQCTLFFYQSVFIWKYRGNYYYAGAEEKIIRPLYSDNPFYNIVRSYNAYFENSRRKAEERKRAEAEAEAKRKREEAERERKRLEAEEQKRRAELEKTQKFNLLIAGADNFYSEKDYSNAAKKYSEAKNLKAAELAVFFTELVKNGDNLNTQENYSAALDYYKKAALMNPEDKILQDKIQKIYLTTKSNYGDAVKFYEALTALNSQNGNLWFYLAYSYGEIKNYDAAITAYQNYLNLNPKNYVGYGNLGWTYNKLERYDAAIESFKNSINLKPDYDFAHNWLESAYAEKYVKLNTDSEKVYTDAVKFYTQLINKNQKDSTAYYWLGRYYDILQKYPDAVKALQTSAKLKPALNTYVQLGQVYENWGKKSKAISAYKKALEINPDEPYTKNKIAALTGKK